VGAAGIDAARAARIDAMPYEPNPNDMKLLTPLLVMGLIIICGFIFYAYLGHTPSPTG
jgi:hypothetical protein